MAYATFQNVQQWKEFYPTSLRRLIGDKNLGILRLNAFKNTVGGYLIGPIEIDDDGNYTSKFPRLPSNFFSRSFISLKTFFDIYYNDIKFLQSLSNFQDQDSLNRPANFFNQTLDGPNLNQIRILSTIHIDPYDFRFHRKLHNFTRSTSVTYWPPYNETPLFYKNNLIGGDIDGDNQFLYPLINPGYAYQYPSFIDVLSNNLSRRTRMLRFGEVADLSIRIRIRTFEDEDLLSHYYDDKVFKDLRLLTQGMTKRKTLPLQTNKIHVPIVNSSFLFSKGDTTLTKNVESSSKVSTGLAQQHNFTDESIFVRGLRFSGQDYFSSDVGHYYSYPTSHISSNVSNGKTYEEVWSNRKIEFLPLVSIGPQIIWRSRLDFPNDFMYGVVPVRRTFDYQWSNLTDSIVHNYNVDYLSYMVFWITRSTNTIFDNLPKPDNQSSSIIGSSFRWLFGYQKVTGEVNEEREHIITLTDLDNLRLGQDANNYPGIILDSNPDRLYTLSNNKTILLPYWNISYPNGIVTFPSNATVGLNRIWLNAVVNNPTPIKIFAIALETIFNKKL